MPKFSKGKSLKVFRRELCVYVSNELGRESHVLDKVGRPDQENVSTILSYTRLANDMNDATIATILTSALSDGPAQSFLTDALVYAGHGHEIFENVVRHFEALDSSREFSLREKMSQLFLKDREYFGLFFDRVHKLAEDIKSCGGYIDDSMISYAIEKAFRSHPVYGFIVLMNEGKGISPQSYRLKFEYEHKTIFADRRRVEWAKRTVTEAVRSGILDDRFAFHADKYEERWCEHCWKRGHDKWKCSTHNSEGCNKRISAKGEVGPAPKRTKVTPMAD
jgi:hypothetical protein